MNWFLTSLLVLWLSLASPSIAGGSDPLTLETVLDSVRRQYPPMLAALLERNIASGRLESARAAFDLNLLAKVSASPTGYYESGTVDVGVEQYTGIGGSTLSGGYRVTLGDRLPDYYTSRTQEGGEPRLELALPLLRDNAIDSRRASISKAALDHDFAGPLIEGQRLEFLRTATVAYFTWVAAGRRLELADALLSLAHDRTEALQIQADKGLLPRIVLTDNRRLVVAREIGVVQARRRFEAAGLTLSLFFRSVDQSPVVARRDRLPDEFPRIDAPAADGLDLGMQRALTYRPEIRQLDLLREKLEVDRDLARNQMQPNLDARLGVSTGVGEDIYFDKGQLETRAGIELKVPLQRREASGRLGEVEGRIGQMLNQARFVRDRIGTEVRDTFSALIASHEQLERTRLNADLALELQSAEEERFRRGAVDMLALQIREQSAFDAQILDIDAVAEYFRALADFRVVTAAELAEVDHRSR